MLLLWLLEIGSPTVSFPFAAPLKLDEESEQATELALAELNETLGKISQLLERMQNGQYAASSTAAPEQSQEALSDAFVASVRQAARPGMKLG